MKEKGQVVSVKSAKSQKPLNPNTEQFISVSSVPWWVNSALPSPNPDS